MWIARDEDGSIWLYENEPIRKNGAWYRPDSDYMKILDTTLFTELEWEDEPVEVDLLPKRKPNKKILEDVANLSVDYADVLVKKLKAHTLSYEDEIT